MAFVVGGIISDKKQKESEDGQRVYYSLVILCLGYTLIYSVEYEEFLKWKKEDIVKLKITPNNKSIVEDKDKGKTHSYFEPNVIGIKKGDVKDLTKLGKGTIGILKAEVISLGKNADGTLKGSYGKISMEGDLLGEMTGAKEIAEGLEDETVYNVTMSCVWKKNVLQVVPTAFEKVGAMENDGF